MALPAIGIGPQDATNATTAHEPTNEATRDAVRTLGAAILPVPVDTAGLNVSAGIALCPQARAAYVTPSHQFPTGTVMSMARRLELLDWAQRTGGWIIEDDYDSEFRYSGQPLASLQGLDKHQRVSYELDQDPRGKTSAVNLQNA